MHTHFTKTTSNRYAGLEPGVNVLFQSEHYATVLIRKGSRSDRLTSHLMFYCGGNDGVIACWACSMWRTEQFIFLLHLHWHLRFPQSSPSFYLISLLSPLSLFYNKNNIAPVFRNQGPTGPRDRGYLNIVLVCKPPLKALHCGAYL